VYRQDVLCYSHQLAVPGRPRVLTIEDQRGGERDLLSEARRGFDTLRSMDGSGDPERQQALEQYKNKLLESREWEAKLKALRMDIKGLQKEFETTEDNIKALQSVGQIIGEVLKQLDEERCECDILVAVADAC